MIAVTGANGLLGRFVIRKLVEENLPVTAIVRANSNRASLSEFQEKIAVREADVLNIPALMDCLQGASAVIHAAAAVSFNPREAKKIFEVNVEGTRNVVNVCLASGISKVIHVSSVAALGHAKGITHLDEESKWVAGSRDSDYAESKYLAELEMFRGMEEGLSVSMVNPSVILAPADWTKSSAQLFRYVWNERIFYPEGLINFVDVRDVAAMIFEMLKRGDGGGKFIASAGFVPMKYFLDEIARRFNKKKTRVKVKGRWPGIIGRLEELKSLFTGKEPLITRQSARLARESFQYNNKKATDVLGFSFRSLEDTLNWCCDDYLRKINTNK